jgi:hypothetical protein
MLFLWLGKQDEKLVRAGEIGESGGRQLQCSQGLRTIGPKTA